MDKWKEAFKEIHGNSPTKDDFDLAPTHIRRQLLSKVETALVPKKIKNGRIIKLKREFIESGFHGVSLFFFRYLGGRQMWNGMQRIWNFVLSTLTKKPKRNLAINEQKPPESMPFTTPRVPLVAVRHRLFNDTDANQISRYSDDCVHRAAEEMTFYQSPPKPVLFRKSDACRNLGNLFNNLKKEASEVEQRPDEVSDKPFPDEHSDKVLKVEALMKKSDDVAGPSGLVKSGSKGKKIFRMMNNSNYVRLCMKKRRFIRGGKMASAKLRKWKHKKAMKMKKTHPA